MNPFEMVVMIVAIVVVGRIVVARYGHASGTGGAAVSDVEAQQMREEIKALKDRVAVLERLATDGTAALEREFEKLRNQD